MHRSTSLLSLCLCAGRAASLSLPAVQDSYGRTSGLRLCADGRTTGLRLCAAEEASEKRREAERLALLAEQAALEAEQLEIEARAMRPEPAAAVLDLAAAPEPATGEDEGPMALQSPMRWIGPYPALSLSLPALQSPSQKARMLSGDGTAMGVTLDFVLDTAANTNTINAQVAGPTGQGGLELEQVGSVAGGVGAGGAIGGGATYMLGACQLGDVPANERLAFMTGLTATALPVAAPAAAGLLGTAFLDSFAGGVQFAWGSPDSPPTVTLYGDTVGTGPRRAELCEAPVTRLPGSGLPSVTLVVNGVEMPALLDTGSPVTVLNDAAAAAAGLTYTPPPISASSPPANLFAALRGAVAAGKAASRGDTLVVPGAEGPVTLARAADGATIALGGAQFGAECRPYIGALPGLSALKGLGAAAGPAAVLGTDVLRLRPTLWYTPTAVYL